MPDPVTALAVTMQTNFNAKTQRCKGAVGKPATEEINHGLRITWISYRRKQRERRDKTTILRSAVCPANYEMSPSYTV